MTKTLKTLTTLAALSVAGCGDDAIHGERFTGPGESTAIGRFAQAQSAAGAKVDAMLHENSFDGPLLNSLGQGKLDLLVKGTTPGQPVKVWVDVPHDDYAARQSAVDDYLKTHGIPADQVVIAEGTNPATSTPAAFTLGSVYHMDGSVPTGAPADAGGLTGSSAAAGGPAASH